MDQQEAKAKLLAAPVSTLIAVIIFVFYFAGQIKPSVATSLALVPANTIMVHFYFWNFFTAGLFQPSFIEMAYSVCGVLFLGTYIEPILGSKELARLLAVTNLLNGACAFFLYVFLYILTRVEWFLYTAKICGSDGILIALLMAVMQQMPTAAVPNIPSLKMQHVPLLCLTLEIVVYVIFKPNIFDIPMVCTGFYYSWWYLRFVRKHPNGTVGDYSEEFAFACMFPGFLRKYISPLCDFVFGVCKLLGYYKDRTGPVIGMHSAGAAVPQDVQPIIDFSITEPKVSADPAAERRRARALKALDLRLASLAAEPELSLDLDDIPVAPASPSSPAAAASPASPAESQNSTWKSDMPGVPTGPSGD